MNIARSEEEPEYARRLLDLLAEVPGIRLDKKVRRKRRGAKSFPDLSIDVLLGEDRWGLIVETKSSGEPRLIRGAIQQLQSYTAASSASGPGATISASTPP